MKKTLPLFSYPGTWVWVDDDKTLLNAMTRVFDKKNQILIFQSAEECLAYLKEYHSPLTEHHFLTDLNNTIRNQGSEAGISAIASLRNNPNRHAEVTAMMIDYNMPNMNGLELAKHTQPLCIPKILLTGHNLDQALAQEARQNLINCFIQKSAPNMLSKLSTDLKKLSCEYFQALTSPLLNLLEAQGKLPLSDPTFIDFFEMHCETNNIVEYYLIDKQGSFLCIDPEGRQSYLAVQTQQSLSQWLSIHGNHLDINELHSIKETTKIPFSTHTEPLHLYDAQMLEGRQTYFWAIIS